MHRGLPVASSQRTFGGILQRTFGLFLKLKFLSEIIVGEIIVKSPYQIQPTLRPPLSPSRMLRGDLTAPRMTAPERNS